MKKQQSNLVALVVAAAVILLAQGAVSSAWAQRMGRMGAVKPASPIKAIPGGLGVVSMGSTMASPSRGSAFVPPPAVKSPAQPVQPLLSVAIAQGGAAESVPTPAPRFAQEALQDAVAQIKQEPSGETAAASKALDTLFEKAGKTDSGSGATGSGNGIDGNQGSNADNLPGRYVLRVDAETASSAQEPVLKLSRSKLNALLRAKNIGTHSLELLSLSGSRPPSFVLVASAQDGRPLDKWHEITLTDLREVADAFLPRIPNREDPLAKTGFMQKHMLALEGIARFVPIAVMLGTALSGMDFTTFLTVNAAVYVASIAVFPDTGSLFYRPSESVRVKGNLFDRIATRLKNNLLVRELGQIIDSASKPSLIAVVLPRRQASDLIARLKKHFNAAAVDIDRNVLEE